MPVGQRARGDERLDQLRRHDQVPEPERREEHLAERPRVDHAARRVEPLERRERASRVAVLAVVVVLEDPRPARARPLEEREPAVQAHRHAERVLVRRRDVDQPGTGSVAGTPADVEPLRVHGDRGQADPRRDQGAARALVARILDPRRVPGIEEHPRREIHRLLGAGHHDDLGRLAAHGPRLAEVRRDRLAKRRVAGRIAVVQELPGDASPPPGDQPRPQVEREGVESGKPGAERVGRDGPPERGRRGSREAAPPAATGAAADPAAPFPRSPGAPGGASPEACPPPSFPRRRGPRGSPRRGAGRTR